MYYKEYYHLERSHWWFLGRRIILESLIRRHIGSDKTGNLKILNVGVATGATTIMLRQFGEVTSVEYDQSCCAFLKEKVGIDAIQASISDLPFEDNTFDIVCAFDVLEHVSDDQTSVKEIKRVLCEHGLCFITVPAFMFLWSTHDDVNHHYRRYTMKQLLEILKRQDLPVRFRSFFMFCIFLPAAAYRMVRRVIPRKSRTDVSNSDFEVMRSSRLMNRVMLALLRLENAMLTFGIKFPFGVSISIVGEKDPAFRGTAK